MFSLWYRSICYVYYVHIVWLVVDNGYVEQSETSTINVASKKSCQ